MKHIAILDFGSQYTHLISRNIRELGVLAKIYHHDVSSAELKDASGIILSGGPQSVYGENSIKVDADIFRLNVPILGLCYGHQLIAYMLGGKVKRGDIHEFGSSILIIKKENSIFSGIGKKIEVWMSHGDSVSNLPKGFEAIASTKDCAITAMADNAKKIYGFQFHPEVADTQQGFKMIENFVLGVCHAEKNWNIDNIISDLMEKIQNKVKDKKVFILCSGGVDSNVAFALLSKALGIGRVQGLYIDTGFMRQGETKEIVENYKKAGFSNIETINASEIFLKRLKNIFEPEEKRKIIGQTFLDVKDEVGKKFNLDEEKWLLGQGTIYPDTIESGATKNADKIKTHHNRIDAIINLIEKGMVIEPLVDFYKDEVRSIGKMLRLPKDLIDRHPFPGPGLAIRCLCYEKNDHENKIKNIKKKVDRLYKNKFKNIRHEVLPIKSVGVQGDNRTYAHPLVIWGEENWDKLGKMATATTNSIREINRIMLFLNSNSQEKFFFKLPSRNLYITKERIKIVRMADEIIHKNMKKFGVYNDIWQFPVVLIPICDRKNRESIVLRPLNSRDVMTLKFYQMKKIILKKITEDMLKTGKISFVFYDITNKPPGTVEWE